MIKDIYFVFQPETVLLQLHKSTVFQDINSCSNTTGGNDLDINKHF